MKNLSHESAANCEAATSPASTCRCRCNGACHGRGLQLSELAKTDPHYIPTAGERKAASRQSRQTKRREKWREEHRRFIESVRARNPELAKEFESRATAR
jgi:hypothetical protein